MHSPPADLPEFIQHAPLNSAFTFYGAPVWHSSFPPVRLPEAAQSLTELAREGHDFSRAVLICGESGFSRW